MAALFNTWKKAGTEVVVKQVSSPAALNKEWKKKEIAYVKVLAEQREKFTAVVGEIYNGTSDEGKALLRSPSVDVVKKNPALVQDLVQQLGSRAVPGFRFLDANINKFSSGANTSSSIAAAFGLIKGLVPSEEPASTTEAAAAPASESTPADKVEDASASTVAAASTGAAAGGSGASDAKEAAEAGAVGLEMIDKAPTYQRQKSIHDDYVAIDQDTIALFLQSQGDNEEEGGEEAGKTTDASKKALAAGAAALAAGAAGISAVVKSPGAAPTPSSTPTGASEVPAIAALPSPTTSSPIVDTAKSLSAAAARALNEVPTPLAELGSDAPAAAESAAAVTEKTLSEKAESIVASAKESVTSSVAASAEALKGSLSAPEGPSVEAAVDSLTSSASAAAESLTDSVSKSASFAVGSVSADTATATATPSADATLAEAAAAAAPEKPKTLLDLAPPSDSLTVPGVDTVEKGVAAAAADVAKVATDVEASVVEVAASAASEEKEVISQVLEAAGTSATTTVESVTATATEAEGAVGAPGVSSPSVQAIIKKIQGTAAVASPVAALEAAAPVIEDVASKAGVSAATTESGIQGVKSVVAKFEEVSKSATTSPALKPSLGAEPAMESIDAKMEGAAGAATEAVSAAAGDVATKLEEKLGDATSAAVAGLEGATKSQTTEEKTAAAEAPTVTGNAKLEDVKADAPVAPMKHKRTSSFNFITRFLKEESAKSQPPVVMEVTKENETLTPIVPPKSHRRSGSLALFGCFSKSKTME